MKIRYGLFIFILLFCGVRTTVAQTNEDLKLVYEPLVCVSDTSASASPRTLTVKNGCLNDAKFAGGTFKINWGDNTEDLWVGTEITHRYADYKSYTMRLHWTSADATTNLQKEFPVTLKRGPVAGFTIPSAGSCVNGKTTLQIDGYENEPEETQYSFWVENKKFAELTQQEAIDSNGIMVHVFDEKICDGEIKLLVRNECVEEGLLPEKKTATWITVMAPLEIDFFVKPHPVCSGLPFELEIDKSKVSVCNMRLSYSWILEGNGTSIEESPTMPPYNHAGEYDVTLIAKVTGYPCANDTVTKTIKVIERVKADFSVAQDTLCASEIPLKFVNHSSGDSIRNYEWTVDGTMAQLDNQLRDFSKVFANRGEYNVKLSVRNSCSSDAKDTTITVKQSPEIISWTLPDTICPISGTSLPLDMERYVGFAWKGNSPDLTWTINPDATFESGSAENSEFPVLKLDAGKKYTISVTLKDVQVNGTTCGDPTKLTRTSTLWVSNPAIISSITPTPSLQNDTIFICEGGEIAFTNNSTGENLKHLWSVTSVGNNQSNPDIEFVVGSITSASPTIRFKEYGDYRVKNNMSVRCNNDPVEFYVRVKKDPEILVNPFPLVVCPQDLVDMENYIDYEWYNNKPYAHWTISPNTYEFKSGTDENTIYPVIHFKTSESYTLKVELTSTGCPGGTLSETGNVRVRESALKPGWKVTDGGVVCEGGELKFTNSAKDPEGGLRYKWTIAPPDSCEFMLSDTSAITKIKFKPFGDYQVTGSAIGYCDRADSVFQIHVKKDPEVRLRDTAICPGRLNVGDFVGYKWYNNTPKVTWVIAKEGGDAPGDYSLSGGTTLSSLAPIVDFKKHGKYRFTATLDGVACDATYLTATAVYTVYDTAITGTITPNLTDVCEGEQVVFNNTEDGVGVVWRWSVEGKAGGYVFDGGASTSTAKSPTITFNKFGQYKVKVVTNGTCNRKEKSYEITVRGVPQVSISDIAGECEPFLFKSKNRVLIPPYNDTLYQTSWTITPAPAADGFDFMPGHTNASPYPDVSFRNGIYNVTVKYWSRCPKPGEASFSITVDKFVPIEKLRDTTVCVKTAPFLLTALPTDGDWSLNTPGLAEPSKILYVAAENSYFSPALDAYFTGDIELVYSRANGSCMARDTMSVHINPLPIVSARDDDEICVNIPSRLMIGEPAGGHWEQGNATLSEDLFVPQVEGDVQLKYYFTDGNTCTNSDSMIMTVHPLPNTKFTTLDKYCRYADAVFAPIQTDGNRFVWDFGDNSPGDSSTHSITHCYDIYGDVGVSNVTTSKHGCVEKSDTMKIEIVNLPPPAFFDVDTLFGCAPFEVNISVDTMTYKDDHNHLSFRWIYGDGSESEGLLPLSPKSYPSGIWDTVYVTTFEVYNMCKTEVYDTSISVLSVPRASFKLKHDWDCAPVKLELQNTTTGNRSYLVWDFGDGKTEGNVGNPIHEYTTGSVATMYYIKLTATNQCDTDAYTDSLLVKPTTISAHFSPSKRYACVDEELCFRNNSTDTVLFIQNTKWDFGDGAKDTLWHMCHTYSQAGDYVVSLEINNGCGWDTISDRISVYPLPQLSIDSKNSFCEDDTVHFVLHTDQELKRISWDFGDGQTGMKDSLYHVYDGYGVFNVKVEGVSAKIGSCVSQAAKDVTIYNKPIVTISPIDTFGCSPLHYAPTITGEGYFIWNYGDGTEMISHNEHVYENLTDTVLQHTVTAYVETDRGCKSDYQGVVRVYNVPRAKIDKEVTVGNPEKVLFINNSQEAMDGIWYLPTGEVIHSHENQQVEFPKNGLYTLSFVASNKYGCKDSLSLEHEVLIKGLYFPNTFIPHSSNDKVNHFNGIGMGLREYKLEVYDLYGNKLWETRALNEGAPSEGWDGTDFNGKAMPQGVYIWKAKAIFADDEVWTGKNPSGVTQTLQGSVMLLRE